MPSPPQRGRGTAGPGGTGQGNRPPRPGRELTFFCLRPFVSRSSDDLCGERTPRNNLFQGRPVMSIGRRGLIAFSVLLACTASLAAAPPKPAVTQVLVGSGVAASDLARLQAAVDRGGTIVLRGTFALGDTGSIVIARGATLTAETRPDGTPEATIVGGQPPIWFEAEARLVVRASGSGGDRAGDRYPADDRGPDRTVRDREGEAGARLGRLPGSELGRFRSRDGRWKRDWTPPASPGRSSCVTT